VEQQVVELPPRLRLVPSWSVYRLFGGSGIHCGTGVLEEEDEVTDKIVRHVRK